MMKVTNNQSQVLYKTFNNCQKSYFLQRTKLTQHKNRAYSHRLCLQASHFQTTVSEPCWLLLVLSFLLGGGGGVGETPFGGTDLKEDMIRA